MSVGLFVLPRSRLGLKYCHVVVSRHGVWVANSIYWTLITRNYEYVQVTGTVSRIYTLYKSLYYSTHKFLFVFTSPCLVTAPNSVHSSACVLMSLPTGDCLATPNHDYDSGGGFII
jgi:hypothetical protein